MSSLDLELLLESHDIRLVSNAPSIAETSSRDESLLWEDSLGPLTIWRVDSGQESHYRLRLGKEIAVDLLHEGGLLVSPAPGTPKVTVDHFLADQVFPRMLSQKEDLVLHAAAVNGADGALLLLGPSGSGKSTLAASLQQCSWSLMGDDAIIVSATATSPTVEAVYASLRLFPDSINALFSLPVATSEMAHYSSKQRIDVDSGRRDDGPAFIKAVFVLGADAPMAIRRLSVAEACIAMIENSFALDPTDGQRASQRLAKASHLARKIPAFSLSYPREFRHLPAVRAAILTCMADVQSLTH